MLDWRWWRRSRARPGVKPSPEYEHGCFCSDPDDTFRGSLPRVTSDIPSLPAQPLAQPEERSRREVTGGASPVGR